LCEGGVVKRKKKRKSIWCEEEEEEEQLCGVDPKEIIRNYTHYTHTPGRKEKKKAGRQVLYPSSSSSS
jgi:hypothetical protein